MADEIITVVVGGVISISTLLGLVYGFYRVVKIFHSFPM